MVALVAVQASSIICRPPFKLHAPAICHASCVHCPSSLPPSFSLFPSDQPRPNLQLHVTNLQAASRSNHQSHRPKLQAQQRFSRSCHRHYPSLSLKPSLSTSFTTGVLLEERGHFFFLISTPPPNPPDLAIAVLHPLRSLSFPQSLTLSSSSHRVYHVYVVNKYFYFDFWLC